MNIVIKPSVIDGTISAPPSKSVTHRAIIIASLSSGISQINGILLAQDTLYTINACKQFGVEINQDGHNLVVKGREGILHAPASLIDLGNSGSSMRMLSAVATLAKGETTLTGSKRLCERPMKDLLDALNYLGIKAESLSGNNNPPIKIQGGELQGGKVLISGNVSSQYISSLLMVSPFAKKPLTIIVQDSLRSQPYVALTIDVMKRFGVSVENNDFKSFKIKAPQNYQAKNYKIEGDYSSASYLFAAAAISNGKVTVNNLNIESVQGDKYFLEILEKMGCKVIRNNDSIKVLRNGKQLNTIDIDMSNFPDLVPTLLVVAACAKGKTKISNISHLKHKESDRIQAPVMELRKMGIQVESDDSSITVIGGNAKGTVIDTHNDHRIAMAFSILGLVAKGATIIQNSEVVSKSYPNFFEDLKKIGGNIS